MGKYYSYVLICFLILIVSLIVYFCSFWLWEAIEKLGEKITAGKFAFVGDFLGNGLFFFFGLFLFIVSMIYDDHILKICKENVITLFSFLMLSCNAIAKRKNIFKILFVVMILLSAFASLFVYVILLMELQNISYSSVELSLSIIVQTFVLYANAYFLSKLLKKISNIFLIKARRFMEKIDKEHHELETAKFKKHLKSIFDELITAVPLITLILQLLGIID